MAKFEEQMCCAAAKSFISSLDSLLSIHFETNTLSDELIAVMAQLNLTQQTSLVKRARHYLAVTLDASSQQSRRR